MPNQAVLADLQLGLTLTFLQHGRVRELAKTPTVAQHDPEGAGVPSSEYEHIFDRFVRLKSKDRQRLEGSGLGLAICRGIIELHKGRILAETGSNGRALRVVFEIPAQPPPPRAPSLTPDELAPATSR